MPADHDENDGRPHNYAPPSTVSPSGRRPIALPPLPAIVRVELPREWAHMARVFQALDHDERERLAHELASATPDDVLALFGPLGALFSAIATERDGAETPPAG